MKKLLITISLILSIPAFMFSAYAILMIVDCQENLPRYENCKFVAVDNVGVGL